MVSRNGKKEYHDFVNRAKLRGKLAEHRISQVCLANNLETTPTALTRKMQSKNDFNENELYKLYQMFGSDIFFE